jgi:hypothetical protein
VILDSGADLDVFAPSLIEKLNEKPADQFTAFRQVQAGPKTLLHICSCRLG